MAYESDSGAFGDNELTVTQQYSTPPRNTLRLTHCLWSQEH